MLKDLIRAREKGGIVIPLLEQSALLAGAEDRLTRRHDVFHPSEISGDFCPRSWLLGQQNPTLYASREVGARLQWIFDTGTALHSLVQERLGSTGLLFGNWRCTRWCLNERCTFFGFKPLQSECPGGTPHKMKVEYREVRVSDKALELEGRTDGVIVHSKGKYGFEFKTMNSRMFSTLAEPLDEHVEQGVLYIDTLQQSDAALADMLVKEGMFASDAIVQVLRMPYKGTVIVYMNKDTQEFKEFVVDAHTPMKLPAGITFRNMGIEDDEDWLEDKKVLLRETLKHRDAGTLADRLDLCTSRGCARAKKCFARDACFDEKE